MKQVAGTLRLDLAQYRELAAFSQFGSDLDVASQRQLARGARLTEILKQPQYQPVPVERQILLIFAGTEGHLDSLELTELRAFELGLYDFVEANHPSLFTDILEKKSLDDELKQKTTDVITEFKERFEAEKAA